MICNATFVPCMAAWKLTKIRRIKVMNLLEVEYMNFRSARVARFSSVAGHASINCFFTFWKIDGLGKGTERSTLWWLGEGWSSKHGRTIDCKPVGEKKNYPKVGWNIKFAPVWRVRNMYRTSFCVGNPIYICTRWDRSPRTMKSINACQHFLDLPLHCPHLTFLDHRCQCMVRGSKTWEIGGGN